MNLIYKAELNQSWDISHSWEWIPKPFRRYNKKYFSKSPETKAEKNQKQQQKNALLDNPHPYVTSQNANQNNKNLFLFTKSPQKIKTQQINKNNQYNNIDKTPWVQKYLLYIYKFYLNYYYIQFLILINLLIQ
ncbi:hypothetical protein PPERSA_03630 [Pseudocohnilembus persalinus]|uniref:Uncharacterized protein n=1 Tax=Pseudocohnilembus persalinus TaxID=266149 RepID=A0A0V0QDX1_PSEPJ|nr:hypothetical protein PPERSA_03630 [Pseudocohnilembus persalinus]|eukprot:KRX00409.1 hypothetical protein PPERSA_03630 [Pseudocohnilembus persalinus]